MVDGPEHLDLIAGRPVVRIDVDAGWWPLGGRVQIGARRSPLRTPDQAAALAARSRAARPRAGRADVLRGADRGRRRRPPALLGRRDPRDAARLGARARRPPRGGRGGGARTSRRCGSSTAAAPAASSAPPPSPRSPRSPRAPACSPRRCSTATAPSRRGRRRSSRCRSCAGPSRARATALGGGYLASGAAGPDRLPRPACPRGCGSTAWRARARCRRRCSARPPTALQIGDRVWMRHAKAGELCERFDVLHLIQGDRRVDDGAHLPRRGPDLPLTHRRGRRSAVGVERRGRRGTSSQRG